MDFQEMLQIAREEGRQEGILEGRLEGKEEGREEGRNQTIRESVPKFLKAGIPAEELCTIFRITPEELADIMDARSDPDDSVSD